MTSFASALLLGLLLPVHLSADVAARVGGSWGVAPEAIRLDWGGADERWSDELAVVRILGRGRDGWFAVVLRDPNGRSLCRRVRAGVEEQVMVATHDLGAGTRLLASDLRAEQRVRWGTAQEARVSSLPGPGWEVRRPIAAGERVAPPAVRPPVAIEAGQTVDVRWRNDAVRVTARGVALNSARTGESVRVRVAGRERPLFGRVADRGIAILEEEPR